MVNKFLYPKGGSETYVLKLGAYLDSQGHEIEYFGMQDERNIVGNRWNQYTENMDFHGGRLKKLLYPFKVIYSFKSRKAIRQILREFHPDVIHLNLFNFQITPSIIYEINKYRKSFNSQLKIIYTAHDYQLVCPNYTLRIPNGNELCFQCEGGKFVRCTTNRCIHSSRVRSLIGTVEGYLYKWRKTYRSIDKIIAPSSFMKTKLESNPDLRDKIAVLHNFVDIAESISVCEKRDYVLYFGRYSEIKGIATLVEACKRLPDIPFVFAGSGSVENEIENISNIKNVGFKSGTDLTELIKNARFSVFPSECYENCPFSVLESISLGTPVIGANIGGVPELIDNNKNGELFECGNLDELTQQIKSLWEDKERLELYARQCLETQFDTVSDYCKKLFKEI